MLFEKNEGLESVLQTTHLLIGHVPGPGVEFHNAVEVGSQGPVKPRGHEQALTASAAKLASTLGSRLVSNPATLDQMQATEANKEHAPPLISGSKKSQQAELINPSGATEFVIGS